LQQKTAFGRFFVVWLFNLPYIRRVVESLIIMRSRNLYFGVVAVLVLLAGIILGHYFWPVSTRVIGTQIRADSKEYKFINPLLLVSNMSVGNAPEYKTVTGVISNYISKTISQKNADDVSVYFRDMDSGLYSGVNEDHLYSPASMMKVAVLIDTVRMAEADSGFLDKRIRVDSKSFNFNANQSYPPQHPIVLGNTYTVRELINSMIVDSDNNAENLLEYLVGDDKMDNLFKELQLPSLVGKDGADFLSPQMYSRLYRILYNSTYLSPGVSEETLNLLVNKSFPQGLLSGIPENIDVAHKFGERTRTNQVGAAVDRELHDCGIVYLPNSPYFLCVMTKGQDFAKLQSIISDISKIVWDHFSSASKG
jgi:beta-lactamase class A